MLPEVQKHSLSYEKEIHTVKSKTVSEEALQRAVKRREVKSKVEKERYTHFNAEFQE